MQMWLGVPWPYEVASPPHHFNLMCGIVESLMRGSGYFVSVFRLRLGQPPHCSTQIHQRSLGL